MATTQLAVCKGKVSLTRNYRRSIKDQNDHIRRCDRCEQPAERRYLIARDSWVCFACVPDEVLAQYPGWTTR
jgi:hypothetical protein